MIPKPTTAQLFDMLRHDISDAVDARVFRAHYEIWYKHRAALDTINAVNVHSYHALGYHSARVTKWQPLVRQSYASRVIDRLKSLKKFIDNGYTFADAWYLAGKFN